MFSRIWQTKALYITLESIESFQSNWYKKEEKNFTMLMIPRDPWKGEWMWRNKMEEGREGVTGPGTPASLTHTATPDGPSQSKLLDHKMHNLITGKTCHFSPVSCVRNARALDEPLLRF